MRRKPSKLKRIDLHKDEPRKDMREVAVYKYEWKRNDKYDKPTK